MSPNLSEAMLTADPARLADEAAAISMMGGRRAMRVRGAGNGLAALFESFLEERARRRAGGGGSGRPVQGHGPAQAVRG